ncbi:MAG: HlyD family efflux transporter periplasmic adaptor subunit [Deltaproteobacteria bacterium]|nr:HlyD family efflux transporter periplasmic adaptor subunit [Deltaproteobacteria bacterium]
MAMDGYRTLGRLGLVAALIGAELWLGHDLTARSGVIGYTSTRAFSVAPPRRATLKAIDVQVGALVRAGELLAELDTTQIDDELQAAEAERARAAAAIQAATARLRRDSVNTERRFASSSERASADLVAAEAAARTAAAELAAVEAELRGQADLVQRHLASATVQNSLELRRASLAKQVDSAERVLGVLRGNAAAAVKRTAGVDTDPTEDDLAPLTAQLRATELRIDQLTRERGALSLRAPVDGVVEQLPLHPGELAGPDTPVATVVAADTTRVVACIPEASARGVEVGFEAETTSAFDHVQATGAVESVTREIAPLPARCQAPGSKAIAMGRVAVVALDAPLEGLPGQTQIVQIHARRRPVPQNRAPRPIATPDAGTGDAAVTRDAVPMRVPPALLARSRFEPSGLVWVAALDRYVIVSDDTGTVDRDVHAPWLFTMTADGAVDPAPVAVAGIAELNDLESIAVDDAGAIWVASSQSVSRRGNRPASRQHLVRIARGADGLRAEGVVDLAARLAQLPAATRATLGVEELRRLDIEGLAARGGALYVGLKAPVDGDGRAIIWKIAAPERLLAGDVVGAAITRWATVRLAVEADGREVAGGIADLLFMDDQTLLIAATASGLDPIAQSGALYRATIAGGELTATRVRTFAGLKPEGLALAPGGDRLAVAFDRGAEPALWLELPRAALAAQGAPSRD